MAGSVESETSGQQHRSSFPVERVLMCLVPKCTKALHPFGSNGCDQPPPPPPHLLLARDLLSPRRDHLILRRGHLILRHALAGSKLIWPRVALALRSLPPTSLC
eukprot:1215291-Rhodomonas_salina.1